MKRYQGGVVGVADLALPVEAASLEAELWLLLDAARHLRGLHRHRRVTKYFYIIIKLTNIFNLDKLDIFQHKQKLVKVLDRRMTGT